MLRALRTGATGMGCQQFMIDTISNNLANVNTSGFKKQRAQFQDLYYQALSAGSLGTGVRTAASSRNFNQGNLEPTGDALSVAIEGEGFFEILTGEGLAYTRDGSFCLDGSGKLCTSSGHQVGAASGITIPAGATQISVAEDGTVTGKVSGVDRTFGRLNISTFVNPAGLEACGGNLFKETTLSGKANSVRPGQGGAGVLRGGYLEASNVEVVTEMVNLIIAQRAFELNSKTVETSDQMWGIANNMRR